MNNSSQTMYVEGTVCHPDLVRASLKDFALWDTSRLAASSASGRGTSPRTARPDHGHGLEITPLRRNGRAVEAQETLTDVELERCQVHDAQTFPAPATAH